MLNMMNKFFDFWRKELELFRLPLKFGKVPGFTLIGIKILLGLLPAGLTAATAYFIDSAIKSGISSNTLTALLILMGVLIFQWLLNIGTSVATTRLGYQLKASFLLEFIGQQYQITYDCVEQPKFQGHLQRIGDAPDERVLKGFLNQCALMEFYVKVISLIGLIGYYSWWIAGLLTLIGMGVYGVSTRSGWAEYEAYELAELPKRKSKYLKSLLVGREAAEDRLLLQYSEALNKQYWELYEEARKLEYLAEFKNYLKMTGTKLLVLLLTFLMAVALLWPLKHDVLSVGLYMGLITQLLTFVRQLSWQLADLIKKHSFYKKYIEDLEGLIQYPSVENFNTPSDLVIWKGVETIEFKSVTYGYPGTESPVLKKLSFVMDFNEHKQFAFVGVNGSGKTTLTKLLVGLLNDYEGEILINGRERRSYSSAQLLSMFSQVHQDYASYQVTLRESLTLGHPVGVRMEETILESALESVGLQGLQHKMDKGFDTLLGKLTKDSADLSSGQWQRLAIGRSLLRQGALLILDEPTAAVDPIQERLLYDQFSKVSETRSSILITHRLGATKKADWIMVLSEGKIAEEGHHESLMRKEGIYEGLYSQQQQWYTA